jgi:hypothetical protein
VSFVGQLDSGELLTGTPIVEEVTTTDLTIANKAVNTAALTINDKTVAIGKGVTFTVADHLASGSPYTIAITVSTGASPAQTLKALVIFTAVSE